MWLHAYQAVTGGARRYVQGGGCTTVGVAGLVQRLRQLLQGLYGSAASSLIEAEIVTADGVTRIVNDASDPDLFWALKGGGGGTFGIVTRLTLATHPLPDTFGAVNLTLHARSDEAYRRLLARFVDLYATRLFNPHWGEQVGVGPDNRLQVSMVFQGLSKDQAAAAFKPLIDFANTNAADYEGQNSLVALAAPARYFWNGWVLRFFAPSVINFDGRPGASWTDFWWRGTATKWAPSGTLTLQLGCRLRC
jgi:FAD/FMN-containing dehydrogenase